MSDTTQDPASAGGETNPEISGGGESGHNSGPDANALAAELRKARKQLKQQEQQIAKFSQLEDERKQSELTEIERYKKQADEYKAQLEAQAKKFTEARKRNVFEMAAQKAGAVDPAAAWKLADVSSLEVDDEGNVANVSDVLKALQKQSPYLFGAAPQNGNGTSGANPSNGAPKVDAKKLASMSDEEFRNTIARLNAGEKIL